MSSEIYCSGDVLHTIQMAKIFNDSKTFVDMKLKRSPKETVQLFHEFMAQHADRPTKNDVIQFVSVSIIPNNISFEMLLVKWAQLISKMLDFFIRSMQTNFEKRGTEFDDWLPTDWTASPKFISYIKDDNFRQFGVELNKLWKILGKKMKDDVAVSDDAFNAWKLI